MLFKLLPRTLTVGAVAAALLIAPAAAPLAAEQARDKTSRSKPRTEGREAPRGEAPAGTRVSLALNRKAARPGDRVTVTVAIEGAANVGHVPFHLSFDPSVLRFERGSEGDFLRGDGEGTVFLASPASAGSAVVVGLSRLGPEKGVRGKGTLCTLEFTAVGEGDAQLAFSRASVRDPDNRAVEAEFRSTKLIVR